MPTLRKVNNFKRKKKVFTGFNMVKFVLILIYSIVIHIWKNNVFVTLKQKLKHFQLYTVGWSLMI